MTQMATDRESVAFASFLEILYRPSTFILARFAFLLYTPYLS